MKKPVRSLEPARNSFLIFCLRRDFRSRRNLPQRLLPRNRERHVPEINFGRRELYANVRLPIPPSLHRNHPRFRFAVTVLVYKLQHLPHQQHFIALHHPAVLADRKRVRVHAKLSALLSYIRSLQGKGTAVPVVGNTEKGRELYWGKAGCSECHTVNGAGGFLGPDLSKYGENHSVTEIHSNIVKPEKIPGTRGHVVEVTAKDGTRYTGLVRNEDNFSLQLLALDGTFHLLSKSDLAAINFRQELRSDEIGVTLISPGATATRMWEGENVPDGRLLNPSDVAEVVATVMRLSPQANLDEVIIRPMHGEPSHVGD